MAHHRATKTRPPKGTPLRPAVRFCPSPATTRLKSALMRVLTVKRQRQACLLPLSFLLVILHVFTRLAFPCMWGSACPHLRA